MARVPYGLFASLACKVDNWVASVKVLLSDESAKKSHMMSRAQGLGPRRHDRGVALRPLRRMALVTPKAPALHMSCG